jgi:hypothetical protein
MDQNKDPIYDQYQYLVQLYQLILNIQSMRINIEYLFKITCLHLNVWLCEPGSDHVRA